MRTHLKRPASSMLRVNSETHASVLHEANNCLLVLDKVTKDYVTDGAPVRALHDVSLEVATGQFLALVGRSGDRKSTRLNSSHLVISYAVFCLKKKNDRQHGARAGDKDSRA